jgi:hypothetical protein
LRTKSDFRRAAGPASIIDYREMRGDLLTSVALAPCVVGCHLFLAS